MGGDTGYPITSPHLQFTMRLSTFVMDSKTYLENNKIWASGVYNAQPNSCKTEFIFTENFDEESYQVSDDTLSPHYPQEPCPWELVNYGSLQTVKFKEPTRFGSQMLKKHKRGLYEANMNEIVFSTSSSRTHQ